MPEYITGIVLVALIIVVVLIWLKNEIYDRYLAPRTQAKVTVISRNYAPGYTPPYHTRRTRWYGRRDAGVYFWAEFEIVKTGERLKLVLLGTVYADIKEGRQGYLTYSKKYAFEFAPPSKRYRRKK